MPTPRFNLGFILCIREEILVAYTQGSFSPAREESCMTLAHHELESVK